ncbi:unnamed protein product [Rotaria sordida]|uniref:Uncharacterized protein n=1 Tax=Rotaria sordida TaxID=392033 RepID=A0A815DZZ6_9BILA|nr:unnamed protein product [Rotaria sordida]CAF1304559.1 unnamed protein product [Rotaria sordida]
MITPYKTILLIIFVIDKFIIARCLSSTTIIIDVDKGIALHKIGVYAEKYQESIFHIFIPYNNLCIDSPTSDVCEYIQSASPDIVEVGTILPHVNTLSTSYNRENISHIIQEDIRRIFLYHKVDKFIGKSKSIIYFIDNHFYVTRSTTKSITAPTFPINITQLALIPRAINPATLVVEQVFNNKVGYDFLTDEQIKDILALIVSTNNETLDIKNIKENLNMLTDMIVGQTVYALKSCSMQKNEHLRSGPACLAVSTIIRRLPVESSSIYQCDTIRHKNHQNQTS